MVALHPMALRTWKYYNTWWKLFDSQLSFLQPLLISLTREILSQKLIDGFRPALYRQKGLSPFIFQKTWLSWDHLHSSEALGEEQSQLCQYQTQLSATSTPQRPRKASFKNLWPPLPQKRLQILFMTSLIAKIHVKFPFFPLNLEIWRTFSSPLRAA